MREKVGKAEVIITTNGFDIKRPRLTRYDFICHVNKFLLVLVTKRDNHRLNTVYLQFFLLLGNLETKILNFRVCNGKRKPSNRYAQRNVPLVFSVSHKKS